MIPRHRKYKTSRLINANNAAVNKERYEISKEAGCVGVSGLSVRDFVEGKSYQERSTDPGATWLRANSLFRRPYRF